MRRLEMDRRFNAAVFAVLLLSQGCVQEMDDSASENAAEGSMQQVRIEFCAGRISAPDAGGPGLADVGTRSAVGDLMEDDSMISDVNVALYDGQGALVLSDYMDGKSIWSAEVPYGKEYVVLALANVGEMDMPADIGMMQGWKYSIGSVEELSSGGGLPMCGQAVLDADGEDVPEEVHLSMKRLAAEIVLDFRCTEGLEVELDSVAFADVPLEVYPFSGDYMPVSRGSGDYATGNDIGSLMSGKSISLYMLEDMSAGNGGGADAVDRSAAPYISVKGRVVNSSGLVSAEVSYRLYLDWDIRRNSRYVIPFLATDEGIYEDSDRIEVRDGVLQMSPVKVSLHVGESVCLYVPASGSADISYSSDDTSVASVDRSGKVTGLSPGKALIRASCLVPEAEGVCEVEVYSFGSFTDYSASLSGYARAWGKIDFPSATEDDPVMAVFGKDTICVGRLLPEGRGMQIVRCGSHELYYVPSGSRSTVYVWNGKDLGQTALEVFQGRESTVILLDNNAYPRYLLYAPSANAAELVDTGRKVEFFLYLADQYNSYLDLGQFFLPEAVSEAIGESYYDEFFWDYLDCMDISVPEGYGQYLETEILRYGWEDNDEDYLAAGTMCILKSDDGLPEEFRLILSNDASGFGKMPPTQVSVAVSRAFRGQGYIGEVYNYQIAPGSLASDRILLDVDLPLTAEWEIRRLEPGDAAASYEEMWNHADSRFTSLLAGPENAPGSGKAMLRLLGPELLSESEFFANGPYMLRGSITNPVSGDIVRGYYILDIILYVSVLSEVDIVRKDIGSSLVSRTYVPLSEWSVPGLEDFWSNLYPVALHDLETGERSLLNSLVDGNVVDTFEIPEAISDPQHSYDVLIRSLEGVFGRGTGEFLFVDEKGQFVPDLKICRDNMSEAGADGYYHFVRQYDSGPEIRNYLIEAYFGDFGKY